MTSCQLSLEDLTGDDTNIQSNKQCYSRGDYSNKLDAGYC